MKIALFCAASLLVPFSAAHAAGVRIQLEEVTFQIDQNGDSHPIDHQVVDVFPLAFDEQYGSVEKESEHGAYGASYIEVPASSEGPINHNVYLFVKDGPFGVITDGYHNGAVGGAKFKMTVMTLRREGDKVRARTMHAIAPMPPPGGKVLTAAAIRDIQRKVDVLAKTR